jgi:hypothetical protein
MKLSLPSLAIFGLVIAAGLTLAFNPSFFSGWAGATLGIGQTLFGPTSLEDGLVGHWTFDGSDIDWGNTSAEIRDVSGNSRHLNTNNLAASRSVNNGKIGQAIYFDGENDDQTAELAASLSLGTADFSFSTWIKIDSNNAEHEIIFGNDPNGWVSNWMTFVTNAGRVQLYTIEGGGNVTQVQSTSNVRDGEWHHAVVVRNGTSHKIYIDGVEEDETIGVVRNITDTKTEGFSKESYSGWEHFDGYIDDTRVYNRALSSEEVEHLYRLGEGVKVATTPTLASDDSLSDGLVGHWTFDGSTIDGLTVGDVSGNENNGTMSKEATLNEYQLPAIGKFGQALDWHSANGLSLGLGSDASLDDIEEQGGGGMSGSAWVYRKAGGSGYSVISANRDCQIDSGGGSWSFRLYGLSKISFCKDYDTATNLLVRSNLADAPPLNTWVHVAYTWDGTASASGVHFYVDGEEVSGYSEQIDGVGSKVSDAAIGKQIGNSVYTGQDDYVGLIDEVRLYNRILSLDEIKRLYQMGEGTKIATTIKPAGSPLEQGLVGHWTFDGPHINWSDTTDEIRDRSGNGNHGDAQGGMGVRSPVMGVIGQGMSFDGVDDDLNVAAGDASVFDPDGSNLSISAWVKTTGDGVISTVYAGGTTQDMYGLSVESTGKANFRFSPGDALASALSSNFVNDGEWHHIVGVRTAPKDAAIYVDGVLRGTDSTGGTFSGIEILTDYYIAESPLTSDNFAGYSQYEGQLDDLRHYNRALSVEEVDQLYQMGR